MKLYNSLTRKKEIFKPIRKAKVGVYTCGPTVYDYISIGNWRTYILGDLAVRSLKFLGYKVEHIMNITDVGHLTGDNLGDADIGEDRIEKAALKEKKSAWQIAKFYTQDFLKGYKKLNLTPPKKFTKATDYIPEQIELVKKIEAKGFVYKTRDGLYFDVGAYEKVGNQYGQISDLDRIKEGARVAKNPEKKDPRDFALWKFSPKDKKRQMEWSSPWGIGFPGWHVECSAMSLKYLGNAFRGKQFYGEQSRTIDIHIGGEDLKSIHHPNEIAQSEAATGKKPFVKYWLHGAFLLVDGKRMGKSLGNVYSIQDIEKKGFEALALRYFYLTGHYKKQLNFTWQALAGAQASLDRLRQSVDNQTATMSRFSTPKEQDVIALKEQSVIANFSSRFKNAISDDLNMPEALAVVWQMLKSNLTKPEKLKLLNQWDEVLGLDLIAGAKKKLKLPSDVKKLIEKRQLLRKEGKYHEADRMRKEIKKKGYLVEDTKKGVKIKLVKG